MLLWGKENSERESNSILKSVYRYLSGSVFLANSTPPNNQYLKLKLVIKPPNHVSNS